MIQMNFFKKQTHRLQKQTQVTKGERWGEGQIRILELVCMHYYIKKYSTRIILYSAGKFMKQCIWEKKLKKNRYMYMYN